MKTLPQQFSYDQFLFRQIARHGNVVLLEKRKPNHIKASYEVVIVRRRPEQVIHGRQYPARESMPRSEAWGKSGWTYLDIESAESRFRKLTEARRTRSLKHTPFLATAPNAVGQTNGPKDEVKFFH